MQCTRKIYILYFNLIQTFLSNTSIFLNFITLVFTVFYLLQNKNKNLLSNNAYNKVVEISRKNIYENIIVRMITKTLSFPYVYCIHVCLSLEYYCE